MGSKCLVSCEYLNKILIKSYDYEKPNKFYRRLIASPENFSKGKQVKMDCSPFGNL
jgi:hypothetical protein